MMVGRRRAGYASLLLLANSFLMRCWMSGRLEKASCIRSVRSELDMVLGRGYDALDLRCGGRS